MGAIKQAFLFLFLFLFSIILHSENQSILPINGTLPNITSPPSIPSFNGLVFGHALQSNGSPLSSQPLFILARSSTSTTTYRLITDSGGSFLLSLEGQSYEVDALFDRPSTPGMDAAATASLDTSSEQNLTLIFWPAGSVAGTVLENGYGAKNATISVSCPSAAFDYGRINGGPIYTAGEAGTFLLRVLPAGTCVLGASQGGISGSEQVEVNEGAVASAKVNLLPKPSPPANQGISTQTLLLLAAIAIAVAIAAAWLKKKGRGPPPSSIAKPKAKTQQSQHGGKRTQASKAKPDSQKMANPISSQQMVGSSKLSAVLPTLSEREGEIVKFLLGKNGRSKRSTMQHALLIPKTSLQRILRSLERKNIVKLTPFGRNVVAELSGWLSE